MGTATVYQQAIEILYEPTETTPAAGVTNLPAEIVFAPNPAGNVGGLFGELVIGKSPEANVAMFAMEYIVEYEPPNSEPKWRKAFSVPAAFRDVRRNRPGRIRPHRRPKSR